MPRIKHRTARWQLTRGLGGGSASFNPARSIGLWAWWDVSTLSTLFQDTAAATPVTTNGDPIGRINDRSGNGRNVVQTGATTTRPTYTTGTQNGLAGALFDGGDYLDTAATLASIPMTIIVAGKRSATVDVAIGLIPNYNTTTGGARLAWNTGNQILASTGNPTLTNRTTAATVGANAAFIAGGRFDTTESAVLLNGVIASGSHATTAVTNILSLGRISATQTGVPWNGSILEALVYSRALNDSELAQVSAYLNSKWAVY